MHKSPSHSSQKKSNDRDLPNSLGKYVTKIQYEHHGLE